ncbi:type IV secretion system protein [Bifidobacterium sp. SO1]|uniref:type IV secretion system protein n=1 Tax=Bifidobacterium sp. SO1 TaxID=2809029 RepID=UPI001BDD4F77|nr:type IV secretion system protein [Bifidobacterium sp. SO1]MBT1162143.1 hypothetical protein [Bifidobacterium sp. SO1]
MRSTTAISKPVEKTNRKNLLIIVFLITVISLLAFTPPASANIEPGGAAGAASAADWCAVRNTTDASRTDYSTCLPAGRWASLIGNISYRNEPSPKDPLGSIGNLFNMAARVTSNSIPNMFMQVTQIFWSSTLALSQFAATFDPLDIAGSRIDEAVATLINGDGKDNSGIMQGSIPAALVVLAILSLVAAAGFEIGTVKEASKRLFATVLCLAVLIALGTGAANTGKNASAPAVGSPWWVMRTMNSTINKLTVNLNLDGINNTSAMMAYDNPIGATASCQDYLAAMHAQYDTNPNSENSTSNVTKAVNRLWEETALRSWVTMQYGNPQAGGNTSVQVASNARMAYCHVLDMKANTNPEVQASLTNEEFGLSGDSVIDTRTANWIFDESGWISTLHSLVDDGDSTDDRDDTIMQDRAAIFWETCTATGGSIRSRDAWAQLINNMGDKETHAIYNGTRKIRVANNSEDSAKSLQRARPTHGDENLMISNAENPHAAITTLCQSVLQSDLANHNGIFHRDLYGPDPDVSNPKKSTKGFNDTNLGDAATLGWRFDIPNVGGTWSEANLGNLSDSRTNLGAMKTTIDYMYGNSSPDWIGGLGSSIGGFCCMIVFGLLSIILIVAKLMFSIMGLLLVVAFLFRAVPVGDKPKKVLVNWVKYTANLGLTGMLYGALATLATFICSIILNFCSGMASSLTYNILAGMSPVFALLIIGLFCSKVAHVGNPFSLHAMMDMAGGGSLVSGLQHGMFMINQARRNSFFRNNKLGRGRHNAETRQSSHPGTITVGNGTATESQQILEHSADTFSSLASKPGTTKSAGGKPSFADRWSQHDPNTFRGEMAATGRAQKTAQHFSRAASDFHTLTSKTTDLTRKYAARYVAKHPHASLEKINGYAKRRQLMHQLTSRPGAALHMVGAGVAGAGSFVGGALLSQSGRDIAKRGAKMIATAGMGAVMLSNPITAPLGMMALGKFATSRDTWHAARMGLHYGKDGIQQLGRLAKSGGKAVIDHATGAAYLDQTNLSANPDNPFQLTTYDPATDELLFKDGDQQELSDFGTSLEEKLLDDRRAQLKAQNLSDEEINRQLGEYRGSQEFWNDTFTAARKAADVANGNFGEYWQSQSVADVDTVVDPQTGTVVEGATFNRMYDQDGNLNENGKAAMWEARNYAANQYKIDHPEATWSEIAEYMDQHPEIYADKAKELFEQDHGYAGTAANPITQEIPKVGPAAKPSENPMDKTTPLPMVDDGQPTQTIGGEETTRIPSTTVQPGTPVRTGSPVGRIASSTTGSVPTTPDWLSNTPEGQNLYRSAEQLYREQGHQRGYTDEQIDRYLTDPKIQSQLKQNALKLHGQPTQPTQTADKPVSFTPRHSDGNQSNSRNTGSSTGQNKGTEMNDAN